VLVEGSLIFLPNDDDEDHEAFFDARYIYVKQGRIEIGTEEHPYTSKFTMTLHGDIYSPYLPIYGNKVLALDRGSLDMHGAPRTPTWTQMYETSNAGSKQITLKEAVDWKVGEYIVIASTTFSGRDAEKRQIT